MKLLLLLCLLSLWLGPASAQGVVTVQEDADAVLPCSSDSEVTDFDWKKDKIEVFLYEGGSHIYSQQDDQFKGRVNMFKDELRAGNASIKINSTKLEDSGTYTCILGPFDNPTRKSITLNVGAAQQPRVYQVEGTGDWSLLWCEAHGVPKPKVHWRDSSGNTLPSKEIKVTKKDSSFYVTSELKVIKTDHYTCVVTQQEILHQIHFTVFENIQELVIVIEGEDAVLPCSLRSKENIEKKVFNWKKDNKEVFLHKDDRVEEDAQFKERVSHFENELKFGNASIRIKNTKKADSGTYICHFPSPSKQETYIKLHVVPQKKNSGPHIFDSALWIVVAALLCLF